MDHNYLRPQAQAALFQAAANVPGFTVIRNTTDAAGRPGIGIAWSSDGKSGRMFAGVGSSAVLQVAVVDEVGQRP